MIGNPSSCCVIYLIMTQALHGANWVSHPKHSSVFLRRHGAHSLTADLVCVCTDGRLVQYSAMKSTEGTKKSTEKGSLEAIWPSIHCSGVPHSGS